MQVKEVEKICDLRLSKRKRVKKREKRKSRKHILSEIYKTTFLLLVGFVVLTVLVLLSEAAPSKALLVYECCIVGVVLAAVSFWLDKPRRKK